MAAQAERSTFVTDGPGQGLSNLDGMALAEDQAGDILVASEHGVFAYDGRRFGNLGPAQGLPDGGEVFGVVVSSSGRVAIAYPGEIYVSDQPSGPSDPITSLHFRPVSHPDLTFYSERPHRLAAWRSGFVFIAGDALVNVATDFKGRPRLESLPYDRTERSLLSGAATVFSAENHLWETFDDGRMCLADPGSVHCYSAATGLTGGPWLDVISDQHGRVLARSATAVASFNLGTQRWDVTALPDQGNTYDANTPALGLYRTPDGRIITQSSQGLDVLGPAGWRDFTVADGAPSGTIVDALTDGTGQLWFHVIGRGLVRWVGYGHWDTIEKPDGLSDGFPWQTGRSTDRHLWVTTDSGVDEFIRNGTSTHLLRVFPVASYPLLVSTSDQIWAGWRNKGLREINSTTGVTTVIPMPSVETIVSDPGHSTWIGTDAGLFRIAAGDRAPFHPVLAEPLKTPVNSIRPDGNGGVFFLSGGRLRHWYPDGRDVVVSRGWPVSNFEPLAMTSASMQVFWIGGPGGLFRVNVVADRVMQSIAIPISNIRSNTVYAVMIDHRGWVWVGTDQGLSVFNGERWVSVDASDGLLSNDVNQDGLREDPDGSIYVVTSHGVSHLRDPAILFGQIRLSVVITRATIGDRELTSHGIGFTQDPLVVELGTPNHGAEQTVVFRYRMSGLDTSWVVSSDGTVRYPFVPPGRHVLTVIGYNTLTHRYSAPVFLSIGIGYEWWRQWWAILLWLAAMSALLYAAVRVRYRAMYDRQADLVRRINEATAQVRHQAAHDEMTGLLVRREVERQLAERLKDRGGREEAVVAILDVDHFKNINDSCGHLGGDDVLRALGQMIRRHLRSPEIAGRYGGEEALLVLDDHDGCAAERILKLHLAVRHDTFNAGGKPTKVTCSIGVAWVLPGDSWETLIGRADAALYEAKHAGRDRVVESRHQNAKA